MAEHQKPREKMLNLGPASLSDAELLSLFIGTGSRGRNAIEIGQSLINSQGSIGAMGSVSLSDLAKEYGMGQAKACRLAGAFELGMRVSRERMHAEVMDAPEAIHRCEWLLLCGN